MKLSVVISVFESYEIVRRQVLHWEKMGLPDDVEILLMDDSSNPPISVGLHNVRVIPTELPREDANGLFPDWRVSVARNKGAKLAKGEFLLMTDIDYIIRREDIEAGRNMRYDKQSFRREFGVILEDGTITQDLDVLRSYGLLEERIINRGVQMSPHPNNFIMRKSTFFGIGGYRENKRGDYPAGGDRWFKRDWTDYYTAGKATLSPDRTTLLMFPNGQFCGHVDYNPFGLFHNLSRISKNNPFHKEQGERQWQQQT